MKKIIFTAIFAIATVIYANAQEVGIRFGGTNSFGGAAIDGVFGTGSGRIHGDLGFYRGGLGVDALWDFLYKPLGDEAFNWYLGAGATTYIGDDFWLGVCAEVGLEYKFTGAPITIGADWRPSLWVVPETTFGAGSFGLNVRYRFGQ